MDSHTIPAILEQLRKESVLSPEALANLEVWLTREDLVEFRPEILELIRQKAYEKIEDAFYTHIRIGTGGIRGPMGVGPNRINRRTIAEAAQGLTNFIKDLVPEARDRRVVVGYEARRSSREFAQVCCEVFAAQGIKSYLFDGLRATPEISFAVRFLKTAAGVQITASHNPRTDNGFKFYWSDGGQIVPPVDQKFMQQVEQVTDIRYRPFAEGVAQGSIEFVGPAIDDAYRKAIHRLSQSSARSAAIVFSPIHGAGSTNVLPVLREEGYRVEVVPEQIAPDENFPTAVGDLINPEYRDVMERPIALAERLGFDLALTSDPDADRIGVAAKKAWGRPTLQFLTGNEVGAALTHYRLEKLSRKGLLHPGRVVIETYVTTSLIRDIAKSYGVTAVDDLLVGFKYIAQIIEHLPDPEDFVFAAEESLGYLAGTFVRDKDAAIAALLLGELVSELKDQGKTLPDYLDAIYEKYGYYKNVLHTVELPGKKGFLSIERIMVGFRQTPPSELAGFKVLEIVDRLPEEARANYKVGATGDQLTFILSPDHRSRVTVRPSGTEPKVKYYIQHCAPVRGNLEEVRGRIDQEAQMITDAVSAYGESLAGHT